MMELLTIVLEAHSDERNHHRRYEVSVGRDLLEHWVVTIRYGRVGWPARRVRFSNPDVEAARSIFADRLRRRLSAPRRIGYRYHMIAFSSEASFDGGHWAPASLLAGLLA
jgi:predicted DNA-binding WGR domain protein